MEPSSFREDILEALFKVQTSGSRKPVPEDIASMLGRSPAEIHAQLRELEQEGALIFDPDGSLLLTPSGKERGGRVMRKHRILECFFSEMLGMSPDTASEEACTLEHGVSDDTIERLGRYLQSPGLCRGVREVCRRESDGREVHCLNPPKVMSLSSPASVATVRMPASWISVFSRESVSGSSGTFRATES